MEATSADTSKFKSVVKGANFITNKILRYEKRGPFIVEISTGEMFDSVVFGVTVVEEFANGILKNRHDLSSMCHSMVEVDEKLQFLESLYENLLKKYMK